MKYKNVPDKAMFAAFAEGQPAGRFELDELRFNEFQRGWKQALIWVNLNAVEDDTPHSENDGAS